MLTALIILGVLVVLVGGYVIAAYNGFVSTQVKIDEAWSDIQVQIKRRYDLIPQLINTVKGYANHESDTFQKVTEARTAAMNATGDVKDQAAKENMLTGALKSLFAVSEAYPELKANENFMELQKELSNTENQIQGARRFYNGNVKSLNTKCRTFPSVLIAKMFGFAEKDFFELNEAEATAASKPVEVSF